MRITVNRILETSRFLATQAGQDLQDFILFVAEAMEQTIRTLRQGITFKDNVRCLMPDVELKSATWTTLNTEGRSVVGMWPIKVVAAGLTSSSGFVWRVTDRGLVEVKMDLTGAATATVSLIVLTA